MKYYKFICGPAVSHSNSGSSKQQFTLTCCVDENLVIQFPHSDDTFESHKGSCNKSMVTTGPAGHTTAEQVFFFGKNKRVSPGNTLPLPSIKANPQIIIHHIPSETIIHHAQEQHQRGSEVQAVRWQRQRECPSRPGTPLHDIGRDREGRPHPRGPTTPPPAAPRHGACPHDAGGRRPHAPTWHNRGGFRAPAHRPPVVANWYGAHDDVARRPAVPDACGRRRQCGKGAA
jgi:hypothetical protein